ncbi:MAG: MBG-2 domain-containing protein, partial [Acidobacteria bacterium]|nr:MBG-2 domain-containing protein [Acidobacteriota bacterium]
AADGVSATYSRTTGETVAGSPYTISAVLSPAGVLGNYAITYSTANFTITQRTASVTPATARKTYGDAEPSFTGALTGFLAADGVRATYSRTSGETVAGSPYTISAVLSPAGVLGNYAITYTTATFAITQRTASVTPAAASKTYGDADPSLTGALTGFLAADGVSATYSRTSGETVAGSPYTISAVLSPTGVLGNYAITYTTASFAITQRNASVTAGDRTKAYGEAVSFAGTEFTTSGLVNSDTVASVTLTSAGAAAGAAVQPSGYGITPSAATGSGLGNYTISYVDGTLTVSKATLTVTADDKTRPYGATNPALTASYSGFKNSETLATSGVTGAPALSTTATETSPAGPYPITAAAGGLASSNYAFSVVDGTLTVTAATTTVTVTKKTIDEGSRTFLTLTVANTEPDATVAPTGTVSATADGTLSLNTLSCALVPGDGATSSCDVETTGLDNAGGTITATFTGGGGLNGDTGSETITVNNVAPSDIRPTLSAAAITENESVTLSGTFTDPGTADTHTVTIMWGDGQPDTELNLAAGVLSFSTSHQYLDDNPTATASDVNSITVTVRDKDGASGQATTPITVNNGAPQITTITGPAGPLALGSGAAVAVSFTDVGSKDTHECAITWDDGQTSTVTASGTGNGSCSAAHSYAAAGVYTLTIDVTDDDTGKATKSYEFIVVYDSAAGFVTGGGWINSPVNAYLANPSLTGRANFGFVSKYQKGASVPTGQTEFQFQVGNLNFHSTVYEWLVVAGEKAQYKGSGNINGSGDYGFILTATDGEIKGGVDKFRIKITDKSTGAVVYDNKRGDSDDIDKTDPQAIAGGSIVIHSR